ncbi:thioredoxin reductase [Bellilinea caldifistulae]|uniref:Sulfurtransferase n=1 Tax=Bellilinea caldifistulae TaxID=360411 RepID=A0A0N8GLY5_9CHLR|nr:FAD-dependent oxidoreductase [Bellilinea caldifistulae]KPL73794.1 sulfurtransferase [Bellilinea caldifistulae]GAP11063.1 thioredoxin reductase [Bellilinea caldifistulae]
MSSRRIQKHPILPAIEKPTLTFFWQDQPLVAHVGETIASALIANNIHVFGHHPRDESPLGIFCANGQCAQCMVIADGKPVKSCMELVKEGIHVYPANGLPALPKDDLLPPMKEIKTLQYPVLIIGGGPAGLSAAIELGKHGVSVLLVDDKHRLGGKLVLQTHRFFGSSEAVFAGTRGIDIATRLEQEVRSFPSIDIWLNSTALAVFEDQKVGILKNNHEYVLVQPQVLLVACGAREKFLAFDGNGLPGVIGAGAFQTLVNRDLVKPCDRLFIVGGGNVGLIAGYHALQAGIEVVGLVEALPECGGYKVHKDKLVRMGVPIYTSHTIVSANGKDRVESVTIAQINENFKPIPGTEQHFECDCVLIAVGLDPVNEFYQKALKYNLPAFVAGDAEEIAEASAAIFSGKIKGLEIVRHLGHPEVEIPPDWYQTGEILKSKPGKIYSEQLPELDGGILPVIHCQQEIPCNPCTTLCPLELIVIESEDIRGVPHFIGGNYNCKGCGKCVAGCPGLAVTLVNSRKDPQNPIVSIPYEFPRESLEGKETVTVIDIDGADLGDVPLVGIHAIPDNDRTLIVRVQAPRAIATRIAGIRLQPPELTRPLDHDIEAIKNETIVCRCEHVTAGEIRELIRQGYRDINEIKALSRAGMGACGSKTCGNIILRLFREEGIPLDQVTENTRRPLFVEVPLGAFAGISMEDEEDHHA